MIHFSHNPPPYGGVVMPCDGRGPMEGLGKHKVVERNIVVAKLRTILLSDPAGSLAGLAALLVFVAEDPDRGPSMLPARLERRLRLQRLGMYLAGCLLFSVGVKLFIDAGLGADPMHSMVIGIVQAVGLPFVRIGLISGVITAAFLLLWSCWNRELPPFLTLVTMALVGYLVDLWTLIGLERYTSVWLAPHSLMLAGQLLAAYASALIIMSGIGIRVMDLVALSMVKNWGWSFFAGKLTLEASFFLAAILVAGPVGISTVTFLCVFVPFISTFMWVNERLLRLPNIGLDGVGFPARV